MNHIAKATKKGQTGNATRATMNTIGLKTVLLLTTLYFLLRDSLDYFFSSRSVECPRKLCDDAQVDFKDSDLIASTNGSVHDKGIFRLADNDFDEQNISLYLLPEWEELSIENRTKLSKMLRWENLNHWDFNVWELNELTGGKPLLFLGWSLLASPYAEYAMARSVGESYRTLSAIPGYHFVDKFNIQVKKLVAFIESIEVDYEDVAYHNSIHAADVFQTLHALLQLGTKDFVEDIHIFSILLAAAGHDVHHPGQNNMFQVNAHTEYAILHNESCLENMHVSSMIDRLSGSMWRPEIDIISGLCPEQLLVIQNLLTSSILHTDMNYHFKLQGGIDGILMNSSYDSSTKFTAHDEEIFLAFLLHASDISNPAKPAPLNAHWADLALSEFFRQGDEEKELCLPVSPLCDRENTNREGSQIGFIEKVVYPTFERLGAFSDGVRSEILPLIRENLECWKAERGRLS